MSERLIWRLVAGQTKGPYPPARLRPLIEDGRIGPLDRFSYDGSSWGPIGEFPELLQEPTAVPEETYSVILKDAVSSEKIVILTAPDRTDTDQRLLSAVYVILGVGSFLIMLVAVLILGSVLK